MNLYTDLLTLFDVQKLYTYCLFSFLLLICTFEISSIFNVFFVIMVI